MEHKQSEPEVKTTTLSHAFSTREFALNQGSKLVRKTVLFSLNHAILVCIRLFDDSIHITYFHVTTRKVLRRNTKYKFINIAHVHDFDPQLIERKNQYFLGIRISNSEFHFISLWNLQTVCELRLSDGVDSKLFYCFMNGNLITWFENGQEVSFWRVFEEKPYATIKMPFKLFSSSSQLPNRNLLVLQASDNKEIVYLDVVKRKIVGVSSTDQALYRSINSENQVIQVLAAFLNGAIFCYELTQDLQLLERTKYVLDEPSTTKVLLLSGAGICITQNFKRTSFYSLTNQREAYENVGRPSREYYMATTELRKNKREYCLITRAGDLLALYVK